MRATTPLRQWSDKAAVGRLAACISFLLTSLASPIELFLSRIIRVFCVTIAKRTGFEFVFRYIARMSTKVRPCSAVTSDGACAVSSRAVQMVRRQPAVGAVQWVDAAHGNAPALGAGLFRAAPLARLQLRRAARVGYAAAWHCDDTLADCREVAFERTEAESAVLAAQPNAPTHAKCPSTRRTLRRRATSTERLVG